MENINLQIPEDALSYIAPIGEFVPYTFNVTVVSRGGFPSNAVEVRSASSLTAYLHRRRDSPGDLRVLTILICTGYSYYASGYSLTPEFYQALITRCWRRSGTLLYRPNQKSACCPHYTLRLDSTQFKSTRDQRQAVNRFNRFVIGDEYAKEAARRYPLTREQARARDSQFDLVERIHESESEKLKHPPQPAHQFQVTLEPDDFTEEKFAVFENYQSTVHGESASSISKKGFKRFLCNSPIKRGIYTDANGKQRQVGSFHQCYRLDGKLVAVGVLDLLPEAVSAVYFMYHESIHKHQPGKLGALREIALAMEGGYRYWWAGYYIHSCPKMRYKIDYHPQYVLDPEALTWDLLDEETLAIFDKKHYVSLSKERRGRVEGKRTVDNTVEDGVDNHDTNEDGNDEKVDQGAGDSSVESPGADIEDEDDDISLFHSDMPGIKSITELESIDLDHIRVLSDNTGEFFYTGEASIWDRSSIRDVGSLKSRIAELAAAIGPDLLPQVCLDFRRKSRI
ncbi:Arginyl-tRNA--protein transferase 1 [Cytospora paraplurivora]|uniref:arginyltransferase n=1 Tax=Cytospora paraplurivora TaxID=2898453 RepID=A0AAN9YLC5_9PEZI